MDADFDPLRTPGRTMWDLIERRASRSPDRVMSYDGEATTTFAEFADRVCRAASGLSALGFGEGTRVSWLLPTWTEAVVLAGALSRLGAVQNPMLPIYRRREVAFIAAQTRCEVLVTPSTWNGFDYGALAAEVATEVGARTLVVDRDLPDGPPNAVPAPGLAAGAVRWIFYTSGTTADPKGAQHSDATVLAGAAGYARKTHIVETDISLVSFPVAHIGGIIVGLATPLLTGSGAVLLESWSAAGTTELIARHRVTIANGAPAIHTAMVAEARRDPGAYASVRAFPSGGSAKPPQLHDDLRELVPGSVGITSGYGMTEAPTFCQTDIDAPESSKRFAEGTPNDGVVVEFRDRTDATVAPGTEGEVVVRGPQVMLGYVDAALDADAFTADRFLHTGDLGRLDEHGAVMITGRLKDVIIRKGENISAKEVEDVLFAHPKIADVAVLGIPDAERGEMVVMCVRPEDPADPPALADVRAFCDDAGLMRQKIPERIEVVDELPRNPTGKVLKHELRARLVPS